MITSNVTERVLHLKYGNGTGTCFCIDYENKQYIVTAKHVISSLIDNDVVEIYFNNEWSKFSVKLIGHHNIADISVFKIDKILSKLKLEPTSEGIIYGQDTYFLGFPYKIQDDKSSINNRNFPLPLVKKAILSGMISDETGKYLLLDGINNPGFSGGPVIFNRPNEIGNFKVAGIISGYRFSNEPVYNNGEETVLSVKVNTGIIIAYNISYAIDLIKLNPIGTIIDIN